MRFKTVLALTDLGEDSLAGLRAAREIADRYGAELVVGHVLVPRTLDPSNVRVFLEEHGFDPAAVTIDIEIDADVVSGIDLIVAQSHPDLVVLSSRRKRGAMRLLWASVPVGLVGSVTIPILALHADQEQTTFSRALVCVDGSEQGQQLVDHAAALLEDGGTIRALMVIEDSPIVIGGIDVGTYDQEVLEKAAAAADKYLRELRLAKPELSLEIEHRTGDAVEEIKKARVEYDADLVVIGSGGIGGQARFFIGRVAGAVVRAVDVAVLVVPTERPES